MQNRGELTSTINFTFISDSIFPRFISTIIRKDLDFGSDHYPIITTKNIEKDDLSLFNNKEKIRNYNKVNYSRLKESFIKNLALLNPAKDLLEPKELETYISNNLLRFINLLGEDSTPLYTPNTFRKTWWTKETSLLIKEARKKRKLLANKLITKEEYKESLRLKERTIKIAKEAYYRKELENLSKDPKDYQKYARFTRDKLGKPPELPIIPNLKDKDNNKESTSYSTKVELLASSFYPNPLEADLGDISTYNYPEELPTDNYITTKEVLSIFKRIKAKSAPGIDKIPNSFLKKIGETGETLLKEELLKENLFYKAITILINSSWKYSYFPTIFKRAKSICLKKPGKSDYTSPKAWRPIALLNTLGKIIELATSIKIRDLAEKYTLLPPN